MKKILLLLALFPFCGNLNAQSAQRFYTALIPNTQGQNFIAVIPNASIYVCAYNDQNQCLTPQPVYADTGLTQPLPYPFLADGAGVYSYYIQSGTQVVEKVCAPYDQCSNYQVQVGDLVSGGGGGTGCIPVGTTGSLLAINGSGCFAVPADYGHSQANSFTFSGTSGDFNVNSINANFNQTAAVNVNAGTAINLTSATSTNISAGRGITANDTSTSAHGIIVNETGSSGNIELNNSGTGSISASSSGGISLTDTSTTGGISLSEGGAGGITATSGKISLSVSLGSGNGLFVPSFASSVGDVVGITTGGQLVPVPGGGGSGGCSVGGIPTTGGIVTGDNTSTNCGYQNRTGDIATVPATVQTFGYQNLPLNNSEDVVAVGASNGNTPVGIDGQWLWLFGDDNVSGGLNTDSVVLLEVAAIGDTNICGNRFGNTRITDSFFFGENNDCYTVSGSMTQHNILAFGDTTLNPSQTTGSDTYNNLILMGDTDGGLGNGPSGNDVSHDVIGIGNGSINGFNMVDVVALGFGNGDVHGGNDVVAVGEANSGSIVGGHDVVTVGDSNMPGGGNLAVPFSGHDAVAIGNHVLACLTTGTDNVALGDYSGSIGYVNPTTCGNSNLTGSNNVWIGNEAGPNTTTQLSNTIGIGFQAFNTVSNQTVIGNSSITSLKLFGCPSGQVAYDDGSGTCFTPTSGGSTIVASAEVVSFSSTPTFSTSFNMSRIVLTGNITSFTLGAGADGQSKTLCFKQGSGPFSVTPPSNVHGFFTLGASNALWNCQSFNYDLTDSIWLATSVGVQNE